MAQEKIKKSSVHTLDISKDLSDAFVKESKAREAWESLTPLAQRDFTMWIDQTKVAETRARRITKACNMLASGKRRPCCYSVVPTGLYKALQTNPRVQQVWKTLSSDERRDIAGWVEMSGASATRKERIDKVCGELVRDQSTTKFLQSIRSKKL